MDKAGLEALIASYTHRDNLANDIPGFIELATDRIGRDLKSQHNQIILDPFQPTTAVFQLPLDYRNMRDISYPAGGDTVSLTSRNLSTITQFTREGSNPISYVVIGDQIEIRPFQAKDFRLIYYHSPAPLVDPDDTNKVLTNYSYLYLYASLIEAFFFTQDGPAREKALETYISETETINGQSARSDAGSRPTVTRAR